MTTPLFSRRHTTFSSAVAVAAILAVALAARLPAQGNASATPAAAPAAWTGDLSPITPRDWSPARAAHLIERAGFGAAPEEIARLAKMTPAQVVDELVDYESIPNDLAPFDESNVWDQGMDPFPPSRMEAVRIAEARGEGLGQKVLPKGTQRPLQPVVDKFFYGLYANRIETQRLGLWWANRMLASKHPLQEKLTLFWHGHFATGENKVRDYRMMLKQNEMFRTLAEGPFRDLVVGVLKDPAMLVYLDNGENIKAHPNENFGRELLELFTMGVGNYSERDVREAARSFTGWTNDVLTFKFDKEQHDFGEKAFLGRTGPFNGEDIVDIILAQPVTAEFIAGKVYRFFVREDLPANLQADLGRTFRDSGYRLKPVLKRIFLSKDFYSAPSVGTQIKSPVHLVLSTYKKLGLTEVPTVPDAGEMTSSLGQEMFDPPNVAGWAGGRTWITPSTLLQRGNLFRGVLFPDLKNFRAPDRSLGATDSRLGARLAEGMGITEATREGDAESNMMIEREEDYNTRYAGYKGYLMAFERTKVIDRRPASINLAAIIQAAHADTVEKAVDVLVQRFLSVRLVEGDRAALVDFLRGRLGSSNIQAGDKLEPALRELLYLVLSTPEYQLG